MNTLDTKDGNMKLTENEIERLLELSEHRGFEGFNGSKFLVQGSKVGRSGVLSNLGFPAALKTDGLYRLHSEYKELTNEIISALQSVRASGKILTHGAADVDWIEAGILQEDAIKNNIQIFKTVKKSPRLDPAGQRNNGMTIIAFNTDSRVLLNGQGVSIDGILNVLGTNREEVLASPSIPHVWPVFNPYISDLKFTTKEESLGSMDITALNTAIPPKWMTHSKVTTPKFGGFIGKLVNHLFPDPEDLERVLDWCHYAIFKRNGTVLCLAGDRGTGKSTFVEVMSELVGSQYAEIVSDAILKEKFNGSFKDKRLIIFEEVALEDQQSINKVKAWCNSKISLEEKGMNQFTADNFSSMVFLLNNLADLKVLPQERRFSIPVVAQESLLTVLSEKEIDNFKVGLADRRQDILDQIAEFGHFLKNRKPKYSEHTPIKGANFFRVSDLALTEWQAYMREFIQNRGEIGKAIPITVIFPIRGSTDKDQMKFPTKKPLIDNFLRDYRFQGKYKIGDIVDLTDAEIGPLEKSFGVAPQRQVGSARTRRLYGVMPRPDFLKEFGIKYKKAEDLL